MNPFTERYKTLSNADLLKVTDNPSDYQPMAIEAAESALNQRQLTAAELEKAKAENQVKKQEKQEQTDKKIAFENKIKDIGSSIADVINPIQRTPPSANRVIAILSIVFGVLFLYQVYNQFGFIKYMLTYKDAKWGFEMILYFLPLILLPLATFLFWRRKKTGWILFSIFFTFSALGAVVAFISALKLNRTVYGINNILPPVSPVPILMNILFFGGCLWLIYKNDIREIYAVDKRAIIISTVIGIVLAVLMVAA